MNQKAAMTSVTMTTAIVIRAVQVCGQRLIAGGNGMSIRPATGSTGMVCASAKRGLRGRVAAAVAVARGRAAEEMAKLLRYVFGGAERQHGHSEIARPGEHVAQPRLRPIRDALAHA